MHSQKSFQYYLITREFILKYIFGKITMLNFNNSYYPVNFFLPYIFCFIFEFLKISYVYQFDNINYFQDYKTGNFIIPPIIEFKINDINYIEKIKKYQPNVPIIYFLHDNKIDNPINTQIKYFNNGRMEDKTLKNLLNFNNFKEIFLKV
tara:strand:- start:1778 stop:2224 length:447 start_codon:yes stop_codon:yes gene_type:complete